MSATSPQSWMLPAVVESSPLSGVDLPLCLRTLLSRRGFGKDAAEAILAPPPLPDPRDHFPDLEAAVARVCQACERGDALAVCGDYDADGMTSTALLLRALGPLGARAEPAIPSRMEEGYGLNVAMVERLHGQGIRLLITVDNGVAATEALERAQSLAMDVIVTDHHTIPATRPPMTALLHPATTPTDSPYRGLAGVGLAYVLAISVAERLQQPEAIQVARDLFCIGTVADMAPLTGANRRWLLDGLTTLHRSHCEGLLALQRLAGIGDTALSSEDIGFQLAPRINAVGRLGDPVLVVKLLTETDRSKAMALARRCDDLNRQRRDLCDAIEAEAVALVEADGEGQVPPFLLLAQSHWHHGVIGIVAARLMERYHRPVALLAGDGDGRLRASARAPQGFAVDQALTACADLLDRFGGHPAAGGFTVAAEHVHALHARLNGLAEPWLLEQGSIRPIRPEVCLNLNEINWDLWKGMNALAPFGIGNPSPLFWSRGCVVEDWRVLNGGHLSLTVGQDDSKRRAIAWRTAPLEPMPTSVDIAYELAVNEWRGERRLQLLLKAVRPHQAEVTLTCGERQYQARTVHDNGAAIEPIAFELSNSEGELLRASLDQQAAVHCSDERSNHPQVRSLLEEASLALGLRP